MPTIDLVKMCWYVMLQNTYCMHYVVNISSNLTHKRWRNYKMLSQKDNPEKLAALSS